MKQSKLDESLQEVKVLIDFLDSRTEQTGERELYFERGGLGRLHLDYEEASRYHKCLRNLVNSSVKDDDLSLKTVERALQETLLEALFSNNSSLPSTDLKISRILEDLKQKLTVKRIPYCCYIPVCGIQEEGLPLSIGQIEFAIFDDLLIHNFQEIVAKHKLQRKIKWERLKGDIDRKFYKKTCSLVTVEAKDYEAAQLLAIKKLRGVLDILNFFSTLVPYNPNAWAYLPGDFEPQLFTTITLDKDDGASYNTGEKRIGPLQKLEIPRIIESDKKDNIGFDYITNLLQKKNPNKFQQALVTAIQWAGRAIVAKRREEAFLLYAIALESIILVDNPHTELSYRLRIRISISLQAIVSVVAK